MIFFHIHRTGGSTVWQTLSNAAIRQNRPVIDLYFESWMSNQNPFDTPSIIEKMVADGMQIAWDSESLLIHHHTRHNIEQLLPNLSHTYATIIRDPVDRFISEVFHIRKLLMHGAALTDNFPFYEAEHVWYRDVLGEPLYRLFLMEDSDPDELLTEASNCPYYKDFYFNTFWSALKGRNRKLNPTRFMAVINANHRRMLVDAICDKFFYMGQYPQLKRTISNIAYLTDLAINLGTDLVHVDNKSTKPCLQPTTLDVLRRANEDEYLLLSMLKGASIGQQMLERVAYRERSKREVMIQDIIRMQSDIDTLQQSQVGANLELNAARCDARRMRAELDQTQNHLEQIYGSKFWRMTAPLRKIGKFILSIYRFTSALWTGS